MRGKPCSLHEACFRVSAHALCPLPAMTPKTIVLALLLLASGIAAFLLLRGGGEPPPSSTGPETRVESDSGTDPAAASAGESSVGASNRSEIASSAAAAATVDPLEDDPAIAAALTGFKGRVVTADGSPVVDGEVSVIRGSMDSFLMESMDLFAAPPTDFDLQSSAATTDSEGVFFIRGLLPDGIYALRAHVDTEIVAGEAWKLIDRTPGPGEVVELEDIVLDRTGVLAGRIVDEDDKPVPGAVVRAADLPGQIAGFVPFEWFDPKGGVILRNSSSPQAVLLPPAAEGLFKKLPISQGVTDADGAFRLIGLTPGMNFFMATKKNLQPAVRPNARVKSNAVTELGDVRMSEGEEVYGRVVDGEGEPVVGAEILAGPTSKAGQLDFAIRLGVTDAKGEFHAQGFPPGRVTAAARRGPGQSWVRSEPGPVEQDIEIVFDATRSIQVTIQPTDAGLDPQLAKLHISEGRLGNEGLELVMFGVVEAVVGPNEKNDGTVRRQEDGTFLITGLEPSKYIVLARVPGAGDVAKTVDVSDANGEVVLAPMPAPEVIVQVLDPDGVGLRNALVSYHEERPEGIDGKGWRQLREAPVTAGRTDSDGRKRFRVAVGASAEVGVKHPAFGSLVGSIAAGQTELVLKMRKPGSIDGTLVRRGKPVEPGEFTVVCTANQGDELGPTPRFGSPDKDGKFSFTGLQPGEYNVNVIAPISDMLSSKSLMGSMMMARMGNDMPEMDVLVAEDAASPALLDLDPVIVGPVAFLSGTVTVNSVPRKDLMVKVRSFGASRTASASASGGVPGAISALDSMDHSQNRERSEKTNEQGMFDFGEVPAGQCRVEIRPVLDGESFLQFTWSLHDETLTLDEGEARNLQVALSMGELHGTLIGSDGKPVRDDGWGRQVLAADDSGWPDHDRRNDHDGRLRVTGEGRRAACDARRWTAGCSVGRGRAVHHSRATRSLGGQRRRSSLDHGQDGGHVPRRR